MEELFASQKAALDERERRMIEALTKSKEADERNAFFQRQTLAAEMEAARTQTEKARQSEAQLERFGAFRCYLSISNLGISALHFFQIGNWHVVMWFQSIYFSAFYVIHVNRSCF